jgi:hypothetical protein
VCQELVTYISIFANKTVHKYEESWNLSDKYLTNMMSDMAFFETVDFASVSIF